MNDLISREAVIALAKDIVVPMPNGEYRYRCIDPQQVRELPNAQPERKKDKWVKTGKVNTWMIYICPSCGYTDIDVGRFCPNCGAEMEGE